MANATVTVRREDLYDLLEQITKNPEQIFSVTVARRNDLDLRYPPVDQYSQGALAYVGDRINLKTRRFIRGRRGDRVVIEPAGTIRKMVLKRKFPDPKTGKHTPMKHWKDNGGRQWITNPRERNLFGPVAGVYNDKVKKHSNGEYRAMRYDQIRPWSWVALEGVKEIENKGITYQVA